ncbi:MAG TPA: hypothetical protein VMG30_02730 [Acidobacteriota bacterium]|nr:hypothetical protein [Acidobacteriota bacterium]
MKSILKAFLLLLLFPAGTYCGDYTLSISDSPTGQCLQRAKQIHKWCADERAKGNQCIAEQSWPIATSDEVIESLRLYFSGKNPKIGILHAAFANGHLVFCSSKEKRKIFDVLQEIKASGTATNKRYLNDFINILGLKN